MAITSPSGPSHGLLTSYLAVVWGECEERRETKEVPHLPDDTTEYLLRLYTRHPFYQVSEFVGTSTSQMVSALEKKSMFDHELFLNHIFT